MMGLKAREFTPLAAVSLEELVPQDHFYRHLQKTLDLSFVYALVHECYSLAGRPSIDPVVFFKLQLVMFFEDIRSERLLMRQVADRLSVRWYVGYNLDEPLPDHSTLSKIRTRYGLRIFRRFFEAIVEQCQQAKLIWGKELYVDATNVEANASLDSLTSRFAIEAHLEQLFTEQGEEEDTQTVEDPAREEHAPSPLPTAVSETEYERLATTNAHRYDWIEEEGRQNRDAPHSYYQRVADYRVSTTDSDATLMRTKRQPLHLGYHTHYVVDGGKKRIILNVLVTPSEVMENQPMLDLLWRTQFRWKVRPKQVTGDTKYGTLDIIQAVEDAHIRAYMPLAESGDGHPFFGIERFLYDAKTDSYTCPQGKPLTYFYTRHVLNTRAYRADAATCNACPLKSQCTASSKGRLVHRNLREHYSERVRAYHQTAAYQKAMRKRKVWVEPLFGEAKQWHGMQRFRLRQLWRVNGEALLIASGQNLKRLLQKRGWGRRPFPAQAVALRLPQIQEAEREPGARFVQSQNTSIAAASLASWVIIKMQVKTQISLFSLVSIVPILFSQASPYSFLNCFFTSSSRCSCFLVREKFDASTHELDTETHA